MSIFSFAAIFRASATGVAILALGTSLHAAVPDTASFSGNNFEYTGFGTDHYKSWDIQGEMHASSVDNAPVEIKEMKLHLYSGGASLALETTIESPQATILTSQSHAQGADRLDIIGSNKTYEVTGFDWFWDGKNPNDQIIHVGRNVFVIFTSAATAPANHPAQPSAPVTISSDVLDIHEESGHNRFLFSGNIVVTDGDCQTRCNKLEVLAERSATANPSAPVQLTTTSSGGAPVGLGVGRIEHITANSNVETTQGDIKATGDTAEFFPGDQRVELTGSPQVRALSSDALLEGGRIVWRRDTGLVDVEPMLAASSMPGRIRVTMSPLSSYQGNGDHASSSSNGQRMIITGESLHGQFGTGQRRFDIEKSVRVEDERLNLAAEHLDAEFDPPTSEAATTPSLLPIAKVSPQVGRLNHLAVTGGVTIDQIERTTTTQQAEIDPAKGNILLTGSPHVVDSQSHATIDGNRLDLSTDGSRAMVTGIAGQPAQLVLPSLPGLSATFGTDVPTTIVGDALTMERGDEYSNFTFNGRVHITARDLEATCGELDAETKNSISATSSTTPATAAQSATIQKLVARNFVEITQRRANATQNDYQAHAARAEIYPLVNVTVTESSPADATVAQRRTVELFGDPTGAEGPVRPEVEMPPMQDLGIVPAGTNPNPAPTVATAIKITSDRQWLTSSPTGSTYYFEGGVQIDGGTFQASCDKMQAEGTPAKNTDDGKAGGPVTFERVIAQDHVRITQDTRTITGGKALILPHEQRIEISENALFVDTANGGKRVENANLEISRGEVTAVTAPGTPGKPLERPSIILPSNTMNFDKGRKPTDKAPAGTSH